MVAFRVIIRNMLNTTNEAAANNTAPTYTTDGGAVAEDLGRHVYRVGDIVISFDPGYSIDATDHTNAGKRGAYCPSLRIVGRSGVITGDRLDDAIQAANDGGIAKVEDVFAFIAKIVPGVSLHPSKAKGVHTRPARFSGFGWSDEKISVSVDFDTFTIADLTDPWNEPRTIPRGNPDKNKCPKLAIAFRKHLRTHGKLDRAAVREIMHSVGVVGHSYCAVD